MLAVFPICYFLPEAFGCRWPKLVGENVHFVFAFCCFFRAVVPSVGHRPTGEQFDSEGGQSENELIVVLYFLCFYRPHIL